tara:strand:+ start:2083 stop:2799 length:717 start_codon:yes stop_codon:yes gene_type:complete
MKNTIDRMKKNGNNKFSLSYHLSRSTLKHTKPKKFIQYIKTILNGTINETTSKDTASTNITFNGYKMESLNDLLKSKNRMLSYRHLLLLYLQIGEQLKLLIRDNICILQPQISDIVVIHVDENMYKSKFVLKNINNFYSIVKKNNESMVEIYKPYDKNYLFISPELFSNNVLPMYTSPNTVYYSLALLIAYCLKSYSTPLRDKKTFTTHVESIKETKLYWGILRCIEMDPNDRYYLYI